MKLKKTTLALSALGVGTMFALATPTAAQAHVGLTPTSTAAGSTSVLTFSFTHGCDGSPTTRMTIDIPENVTVAYPTLNPNWTVEAVPAVVEEPSVDASGDSVSERIGQIVYTAKSPIPDGVRDTLEVQVRLPEDAAGDSLTFPVLQSCEEGENNWNEVTEEGEEEPEFAAPFIAVTEATGADEHGTAGTSSDSGADTTEEAANPAGADDVVARVFGVGGLVVGAVGVVLAVTARRRGTK